MLCLSAFAAVGLADLVELCVGDSSQLAHLCGLCALLKGRAQSSAEGSWEFLEFARALEFTEAVTWVGNFSNVATISTFSALFLLGKVLGLHLPKAVLHGSLCSDGTAE